ncbi:hypothetical protein TSAR_016895 [Trichomalopsis sarcophagae]|uniref:Guanylate cyclase domain-containing protein n=1 Tax=Trichomalopsis sarcophagae TaxID=543379 RepID=A0A232FAS2_9HYME|nr:hypothetical protein TSAR_016895 [Trichomalopsis sarcophagae]
MGTALHKAAWFRKIDLAAELIQGSAPTFAPGTEEAKPAKRCVKQESQRFLYTVTLKIINYNRNDMDPDNESSILSPELLGPVFKIENITLRQALYNNNTNRRLRLLATFVPDELVFLVEEKAKIVEYQFAVLLLVDISGLYSLFDEFCNGRYNGSSGLSKIFNLYTSVIIEQVCFKGGDVLKFTENGILSLWKQNENELLHEVLRRVISCSFAIKEAVQHLEIDFFDLSRVPIKTAITAGSVTFSVIGEGDVLHYVITGEPVTAVRKAINISISSDLVLGESAWKHCILSDYVYVIQDKNHVRITKELKKYDSSRILTGKKNVEIICKPEAGEKNLPKASSSPLDMMKNRNCVAIVQSREIERRIMESEFTSFHHVNAYSMLSKDFRVGRHTILDACKSQLGVSLKSFVIRSVVEQIENDRPLEYLTEMRNVTIVSIEVFPVSRAVSEVIYLADKCHAIIAKACENVGCVEDASLREASLVFRIVFGVRSYPKNSNHCRFGISCAWKLLRSLRRVTHVDGLSVGVSTGISCCTVIGHVARHHYAVIGPPITKAENMMLISHNKARIWMRSKEELKLCLTYIMRFYPQVTCDLDTLVYSGIKKSNFTSAGLINLRGFEKGYVFNFSDREAADDPDTNDLKNAYPILSRFQESELFGDILDEIGLSDRAHAGILIEPHAHPQGDSRIGKSRVLDAFATIASDRQIKVHKLVLHPSFAEKPYAVIYKILEQILEADDCKTMDELERNVSDKLGRVIQADDLCYLNRILRVRFKLSKRYIGDSDWKRHRKSIGIFDKILKIYNENRCILLDNVQYMDYMSWQFLAHAAGNKRLVLAMTILQSESWDELSRVETDICKDKRLLRHTLVGLERGSLSSLACQFLDVQGISLELHEYAIIYRLVTRASVDAFFSFGLARSFALNSGVTHPGWYELFLALVVLCCGFDFVSLTPKEAGDMKLIFPEALSITRISADLLPDEAAPPVPWNKRARIPVCLANERFWIAESFVEYDIPELALEIYARLSAYEQDIVECASVLGKVFARSMLEMIIPNHQSLRTTTDIPPAERHLSRYAHCRFMEFKVSSFQRAVYEQIPECEKKKFHARVVEIYRKDARKCAACGGGSFLRIPGKEKSKKIVKPSIPIVATSIVEPLIENRSLKAYSLASETKESEQSVSESRPTDIAGISIMRTSFEADNNHEFQKLCEIRLAKRKGRRQVGRNSRVHPLTYEDTDQALNLNSFGHVDFRNCRCLSVIDCIFMKLQQHIENIDNNDKIIDFTMEYAAALIDFGQPSYALRFLANADERNDYLNTHDALKNPALYGKMIKKSMILCLRGNAYMLLGNYPQAKTNYVEALSMFKHNFSSTEQLTCYKTMYEKMRQNIRWTCTYPIVNVDCYQHEKEAIIRQNTAACLRLVSMILMISHQEKPAKLAALQSILFGFSSYDSSSFYDQCQLYLSIVEIYGKLGDLQFLSHVEKYALFAVNHNHKWNHCEDIVMLGHVYFSVFKVSLLRGHLERAVQFGEKSLRISKSFHMIRLELEILPLLVQALMRLKRVCETVDTLQQLRDTAFEDVDKSASTWYYALCMDLLLDAGILVESYEVCACYARKILAGKSDACVLRDSQCLRRLLAGLWSWQLRKGDLTSTSFVMSLDFFTTDLRADDYSRIITLCKVGILECHLLLLTRCINMKKGSQMEVLLVDIEALMRILDEVAKTSDCVKPHYYLLKAYFGLVHARTLKSKSYLRKAKKCAELEKNLMALAWINHNKNTWKAVSYNNMARYWEENIGYRNAIVWQDVDMFDINDWSNLLYSLPIPDSYI